MNKLSTFLCTGFLGLIACMYVLADQPAQLSESCQSIKLAESGWTDISATTALVTVVAEALGNDVSVPTISLPIAFSSVSRGKIDAFLGYWSPTMDAMAAPYVADQSIIIPEKANLEGAKYTLAVPTYAYEAGLKSFADIATFKKELNGQIFGIEAGNDANILINKMISENRFNLSGFKLRESNEATMLSQVQRAIKTKTPIVFLGWEPHPMNRQIDMKYLEGGDEVFGANYGSAKVFTLISSDFQKRCPVEAKLISQIRFTVDMENELMAGILDNKIPAKVAAKAYLQKHSGVLDRWLTGIKTKDGKDAVVVVKAYLENNK